MFLSRNLLAFVAVAEELHFGRAAQRLHISQPPLSQQIRQFEEEVGAPLLVRTTRSVQLTPAGRLLLERAHQLMADGDVALHAVRRHARGDEGALTLGFTHSTVYRVLPQVLKAFREECPEVVLELRQLTSDLLVDNVRSGHLDVALLRFSASMETADVLSTVVTHDPMVLALPVGHPLAAHERVPAHCLQDLPWVGYEPQGARYFHELENRVLAAAQVQPQVRHHSLLPTLLALVEAGMGAALVPASALQGTAGRVEWRQLMLPADCAPLDATLSCVWSADNWNPVVQRFLSALARTVRNEDGTEHD